MAGRADLEQQWELFVRETEDGPLETPRKRRRRKRRGGSRLQALAATGGAAD
ncbi:hypothetical protein [Natronorubrum thiooxidans]|uniref:hypothetical protein n=1 Tax=Natronorubrum thiooxidans TaxID=308853 RepID=UPI0013566D4F|nr:hypothetical protein [Natronorubrum thiooxidans]